MGLRNTLERAIPSTECVNSLQINKALKFDTDLVHAVTYQYHCGECAKYIERVYSISGKDKRFPKLPDYIKEIASHCGIILYPFYTTGYINNPYTQEAIWDKDIVKFSNRPYVDNRPQKWIDGYKHLLEINHQRGLHIFRFIAV